MSRLEPPAHNSYSPEQQKVHATIASGPRGGVHGPLALWLWRPELAQRAQSLGQYCRYDSSLPPRLSELAILITARHWSSEFEWQRHKQIALNAGVSSEVVEAIRRSAVPDFLNDDESAVYEFATELLVNRRVSQKTYDITLTQLGTDSLVDLVGVLGYYGLISMTINVFEVDPDGPAELDVVQDQP